MGTDATPGAFPSEDMRQPGEAGAGVLIPRSGQGRGWGTETQQDHRPANSQQARTCPAVSVLLRFQGRIVVPMQRVPLPLTVPQESLDPRGPGPWGDRLRGRVTPLMLESGGPPHLGRYEV